MQHTYVHVLAACFMPKHDALLSQREKEKCTVLTVILQVQYYYTTSIFAAYNPSPNGTVRYGLENMLVA